MLRQQRMPKAVPVSLTLTGRVTNVRAESATKWSQPTDSASD